MSLLAHCELGPEKPQEIERHFRYRTLGSNFSEGTASGVRSAWLLRALDCCRLRLHPLSLNVAGTLARRGMDLWANPPGPRVSRGFWTISLCNLAGGPATSCGGSSHERTDLIE